jgi:hypothetical protein
MGRVLITSLALCCALVGCATHAPQSEGEEPSPPDLTAERARTALIDLIRSSDPGALKDFPLERFERDGVEGADGSQHWGPFSLHLKEREYTYSRIFGEPPRVCRWHYRGGFVLREGWWMALPPRVESQELGGPE